MALADQIMKLVHKSPGKTDREIAELLRGRSAIQQPINQAARLLEKQGRLRRSRRHDGLTGNYPARRVGGGVVGGGATRETCIDMRHNHDLDALSEDQIKSVLVEWLESEGWSTQIAWGRTPGIDIEAKQGEKRRIIEVKGPGSRPQMRVNYFLGILGETLQRMNDPMAEYMVALPDLPQFRGLWARLPKLAKDRTSISAAFISPDGRIEVVK